MKLMTRYIPLLMLLILSACSNKQKRLARHEVMPNTDSGRHIALPKEMMDRIEATQVDYKWFAASGQGNIDWDGDRMSGHIDVRIRQDSIIWIRVQKFGFEVGRIVVTPDSAFFINRFERTYGVYQTEEFLEEYNVPADFDMFSKVFTAGAYVPPKIKQSSMEQDGSVLLESGNGMMARLWFDTSYTLIRTQIRDPLAREWSSEYADYKKTNSGHTFPFKRFNTIVIDGVANIFDLEYNEMEIGIPQQFPFSIPSHYEKI